MRGNWSTGYSLELNQAAHRAGSMVIQPQINGPVKVGFLAAHFSCPFQIGLGQIPSSVLASFDRDLQKNPCFGHNQVVYGLVSSILNRHIKTASRELSSSDAFRCQRGLP
jgi:hypothetical protein